MNNIKIYTWCVLLFSFVGLLSCNNEKDLNLNLSEVKTLFAPEDNLSVELKPAQGGTVVFQWDQAHAEDGSLVLYQLSFDKQDGDFSQPFYSIVADGKGVENQLTLSHTDLNKIAKLGGAAFFEKKKFKWTVFASKGTNMKAADQARIIELERPGGFDVLPTDLYLTGSSTEAGTTLADALKMKQTEAGKFEIYTKLVSGTYKFVDGLNGNANSFFIDEVDGFKVIGANNETSYTGDEKIYRIRVDFNAISAQIDEVKSVGFWYCWENTIFYELTYSNHGIWKAEDVTVTLSTVPWGLEERHKYVVMLNDGVSDKEEWWGYISNDSPGQDGQYGLTDPAYFNAYLIENSDQWNYAWKLDRPAIQGKVVDFLLKFEADKPYACQYIIH